MTCSWESKIFASRGCKQGEAAVQSICTRRSPCHIVFTSLKNCCTYAPLHHVVMLEMDCVEQLSVNETWCLALLKPSLGKSALSEVKSVKTRDIKNIFPPCQESSRIISLTKGDLLLQVQDLWCFYVHLSLCYIYYRYDMYYLIHICALAWLCPAFSQACRMWKLGWEPAVTCSELAGLLAIASWSCEHRHIIQGLAETPTSLPIS